MTKHLCDKCGKEFSDILFRVTYYNMFGGDPEAQSILGEYCPYCIEPCKEFMKASDDQPALNLEMLPQCDQSRLSGSTQLYCQKKRGHTDDHIDSNGAIWVNHCINPPKDSLAYMISNPPNKPDPMPMSAGEVNKPAPAEVCEMKYQCGESMCYCGLPKGHQSPCFYSTTHQPLL